MKELTIEHVAPYLPYGLTCIYGGHGDESKEVALITSLHFEKDGWEVSVKTESGLTDTDVLFYCKPILRPLSQLTVQEWMNAFTSCFDDTVKSLFAEYNNLSIQTIRGAVRLYDANHGFILTCPRKILASFSFGSKTIGQDWGFRFDMQEFFNQLYKLHCDVFGLIDAGLAIEKGAGS